MPLRRRTIEELVLELLANHKVKQPPVPVDRLVKGQSIRIFKQSLQNDISGFLFRDGEKRVIGVNTHHPLARQRFTLAHELGHFLLHGQEKVHVDHGFQIQLRNDLSSQGVDEDEMEANLFAAELLMPRRFIERDLRDLGSIDINDDETIAELAQRYGVSLQALAIRLTALGYLSPRTEVGITSRG